SEGKVTKPNKEVFSLRTPTAKATIAEDEEAMAPALLSEQTPRAKSVIFNERVFEDDETGVRRSPPFAPDPPSKYRTTEEDPKPPRSDRDVIEEALRIHDNLEVFLRGNSMDGKMKEVFRAEKYSLEFEIKGYGTCPDALLSGKITAIEARIRKFMDLSSAMVKEDRAVPLDFSRMKLRLRHLMGGMFVHPLFI
ncbi:hypothetical protein U1Q18_045303, partial [Sarracenia purpurea var. burkii]